MPEGSRRDKPDIIRQTGAMTSGDDTDTATLTFRTRIPTRYRLILGLLGLAVLAGTAAAAAEAGPGVLLTGLFVAAIMAPIVMMQARIRVGPQSIHIRVAGIFSTEVPYREITAISAGPVTGLREGMGLRILPDGTGYLVGGPSIRIGCRHADVLVSCSEPDRLLTAVAPLLSAGPARRPGRGAPPPAAGTKV